MLDVARLAARGDGSPPDDLQAQNITVDLREARRIARRKPNMVYAEHLWPAGSVGPDVPCGRYFRRRPPVEVRENTSRATHESVRRLRRFLHSDLLTFLQGTPANCGGI